MTHTLHWPSWENAPDALCGDQAWTSYFADDAADITCPKCEADLYPAPPAFVSGLTTCIETIGGDPDTALRLSFQIRVF